MKNHGSGVVGAAGVGESTAEKAPERDNDASRSVAFIACEADGGPIFDATEPEALEAEGFAPETIAADDWRLRMLAQG